MSMCLICGYQASGSAAPLLTDAQRDLQATLAAARELASDDMDEALADRFIAQYQPVRVVQARRVRALWDRMVYVFGLVLAMMGVVLAAGVAFAVAFTHDAQWLWLLSVLLILVPLVFGLYSEGGHLYESNGGIRPPIAAPKRDRQISSDGDTDATQRGPYPVTPAQNMQAMQARQRRGR